MKFRKLSNPSSRSLNEESYCTVRGFVQQQLISSRKRDYISSMHKFTVHKIPFHLLNKRDDEGAIEFQFHVKKLVVWLGGGVREFID